MKGHIINSFGMQLRKMAIILKKYEWGSLSYKMFKYHIFPVCAQSQSHCNQFASCFPTKADKKSFSTMDSFSSEGSSAAKRHITESCSNTHTFTCAHTSTHTHTHTLFLVMACPALPFHHFHYSSTNGHKQWSCRRHWRQQFLYFSTYITSQIIWNNI